MRNPAEQTRRLACAAWILLAGSVACWPAGASGIGWPTATLAFLPLVPPLAGMARGSRRVYRWAPITLAPTLTLAVTETLVNSAARIRIAVTLALVLLAFAALIAAQRSAERG